MIVYGVMSWRTGPFRLGLNLLQIHGLEYTLEEQDQPIGCCDTRVDFYPTLYQRALRRRQERHRGGRALHGNPGLLEWRADQQAPATREAGFETERFRLRINSSGQSVSERWILARLRRHMFHSLPAPNAAIKELLVELNERRLQRNRSFRGVVFGH